MECKHEHVTVHMPYDKGPKLNAIICFDCAKELYSRTNHVNLLTAEELFMVTTMMAGVEVNSFHFADGIKLI